MLVVTVVNTTAFLFHERVWRHGIFFSRQNIKERTCLPEILYNSTNPKWTSTLLKCFQLRLPHALGVLANGPWAWRLRLRLQGRELLLTAVCHRQQDHLQHICLIFHLCRLLQFVTTQTKVSMMTPTLESTYKGPLQTCTCGMLAFCGHVGLGPAHTKPKQAACRLAQARPTSLH